MPGHGCPARDGAILGLWWRETDKQKGGGIVGKQAAERHEEAHRGIMADIRAFRAEVKASLS